MQEHRDLKPEEILQLAAEEGYELTDEELESVAGGMWTEGKCPSGGSHHFVNTGKKTNSNLKWEVRCEKCGQTKWMTAY